MARQTVRRSGRREEAGRRERRVSEASGQNQRRQRHSSSRKKAGNRSMIQKNREKATRINRGFVIFLTVICVGVMYSAIHYLELKSEVTTLIEEVALKESELSKLKEENNTLQSRVSSSMDLNEIRREAMDRLGMKYPSDEQNETYETSRGSFVRQYQDVPDK